MKRSMCVPESVNNIHSIDMVLNVKVPTTVNTLLTRQIMYYQSNNKCIMIESCCCHFMDKTCAFSNFDFKYIWKIVITRKYVPYMDHKHPCHGVQAGYNPQDIILILNSCHYFAVCV